MRLHVQVTALTATPRGTEISSVLPTIHSQPLLNHCGFSSAKLPPWQIPTSPMATKKSRRSSYPGVGGTVQVSEPRLWLNGNETNLLGFQDSFPFLGYERRNWIFSG